MFKKIIAAFLIANVFAACSGNVKKEAPAVATENKDSMAVKQEALYKDVKFDSPKDLACGMPVTAGVADTAHYKGKVYGFCSKECKDEFLKSPEQYLTVK